MKFTMFAALAAALVSMPFAVQAEEAGAAGTSAAGKNAPAVSQAAAPAKPELTAAEKELKELKDKYERISYNNKIYDENLKEQMKNDNERLLKLITENKLVSEEQKKELAELTAKFAKLKAEHDITSEEIRAKTLALTDEKNEIDMAIKRMDYEEKKAKHENEMLRAAAEKLKIELEMRGSKDDWKQEANTEPLYLSNPFDEKTGTLTISDRRIPMNGIVMNATADYVNDRIEYFNNVSTAPIFIVIDTNYGGSVRAGYRILKAMESSRSPVYVVVKSFAASMAAVITTLAPHSFIYENAIILHHQMSSGSRGNMTQMKEALEAARELDRRMNTPVAKKMGISLEEFRKKMYEHNSDGDWEEYGDKAVKLHWVDKVVKRVEETGVVKKPEKGSSYSLLLSLLGLKEEQTDANGVKYVPLPRLEPFDFYYIYNRDNYFR